MLVGGRHPSLTTKTARKVIAWDETAQRWEDDIIFTNMPVARDAPTAVGYDNKWLIVAGGRDDAYQSLSRVDLLDLHKNRWYSGAPLPQPAHRMTAAVIGNTLVLQDGAGSDNLFSNQVFSVQLDDFISQVVTRKSELASPWQNLPDTPVTSCTALAFNGALLAIGGNKPGDWRAKHIHLFKPSTKTWVSAGQLLVSRWRCACTVLPTGEIFIAGGAGGAGGAASAVGGQAQMEVHIATL